MYNQGMNITTIALLDAGIDENGKPWAKVEFRPLVGDPKATVLVLKLGDTLTTDAPGTESLKTAEEWPDVIREY